MGTMTLRNIDDALKARLRVRAAQHGNSMEEEVREILRAALAAEPGNTRNLAYAIRERVVPYGGVDLPETPREPIRSPAHFDE